jgi:hypothetical protein
MITSSSYLHHIINLQGDHLPFGAPQGKVAVGRVSLLAHVASSVAGLADASRSQSQRYGNFQKERLLLSFLLKKCQKRQSYFFVVNQSVILDLFFGASIKNMCS